jgi:CDP-diacylglycerol--inositol 3-phosphatidyltransferase
MDKAETISGTKERADAKRSGYRSWPVYCYVPNLIGYARILASTVAFGVAFRNKNLFVVLYLISFVCDELDGRFARMLNQTSTFGAVLDMITDRVCTASLLVVLTHVYKSYVLLFLGLFALDISSHWLQMYSTLLGSKTSHKDMSDSKSWLLSAYYKYRIFMGFCAVGSEVLFVVLYLLPNPTGDLLEAIKLAYQEQSILFFIGLIAAPGFAIKQWINVVQMKAAADITIEYDIIRDSMKVETD